MYDSRLVATPLPYTRRPKGSVSAAGGYAAVKLPRSIGATEVGAKAPSVALNAGSVPFACVQEYLK